jgi:hypothetical protein
LGLIYTYQCMCISTINRINKENTMNNTVKNTISTIEYNK